MLITIAKMYSLRYSLDRLCGHLTGREPITSHLSIDTIILRFHTDVTYNRGGFNISYEFIGKGIPRVYISPYTD